MAFITYILLAGIAFGIQKRLVSPSVLWLRAVVLVSNKKTCVSSVCEGSLRRSLECMPALPSCGSSSRSWWCCWVCTCWQCTATSPPSTSSPTVDTNMLGKCQVFFDGYFGPNLFVTLYIKFYLKQYWISINMCYLKTLNTSVHYLPLLQDDLHNDMWLAVWQRWLLCGPCLGLLCSYVLYCKYLLPTTLLDKLHLIVLGAFNILNAKQIWH